MCLSRRESRQLVLSVCTIEHIYIEMHICTIECLSIETLVQCIRDATHPQTAQLALMVMTAIAPLFPVSNYSWLPKII